MGVDAGVAILLSDFTTGKSLGHNAIAHSPQIENIQSYYEGLPTSSERCWIIEDFLVRSQVVALRLVKPKAENPLILLSPRRAVKGK